MQLPSISLADTPPRSGGSVFNRLGGDGPAPEPAKVAVSGLDNVLVRPASQDLEAANQASVFNRLGADSSSPKASESSVFKRLGAVKRPAQSTSQDSDEDDHSPVEYAGVLKHEATKPAIKRPAPKYTVMGPNLSVTADLKKSKFSVPKDDSDNEDMDCEKKPKVTINARLGPEPAKKPKVTFTGRLRSEPSKTTERPKVTFSGRGGSEPSRKSASEHLAVSAGTERPKITFSGRLGPEASKQSATEQATSSYTTKRPKITFRGRSGPEASKKVTLERSSLTAKSSTVESRLGEKICVDVQFCMFNKARH